MLTILDAMKPVSELPTAAGRSGQFGALGSLASQCCLGTMILLVEYNTLNLPLFELRSRLSLCFPNVFLDPNRRIHMLPNSRK